MCRNIIFELVLSDVVELDPGVQPLQKKHTIEIGLILQFHLNSDDYESCLQDIS